MVRITINQSLSIIQRSISLKERVFMSTSHTSTEIASQPEVWGQAVELLAAVDSLPQDGERVAVIGCGTSWFMAQAYASLREQLGQGLTDAFTATEFRADREYDRILTISRSGTTTEIVDLLRGTQTPSTLITAVGNGPAAEHATSEIVLDFADETSVVQTRFATTALLLLRTSLGIDATSAIADAKTALTAEVKASWVEADQITFLGTDWTVGLAHEAALKLRESSQSWTESYPAMEYRHGPIAIAQPGRVVWAFGPIPEGMDAQIAATGAELVTSDLDPLAHLVQLHVVAVARAEHNGLNPDTPRHLTRAVILTEN